MTQQGEAQQAQQAEQARQAGRRLSGGVITSLIGLAVLLIFIIQNRLRINLSVAELEPIVRVADLLDLLVARTTTAEAKHAA